MSDEQKNTEANEPIAAPEANQKFGQGKRVMIVDDDPTTVSLLNKLLLDVGFEVATAENGTEAWTRLSQGGLPDLIISDFLMPQMDGFSLFKEIKKNAETKNIPVLILTSRKNTEDSFLVSGVDCFHRKPVDTPVFLEDVKKLALRPKPAASTDDAPAAA